MADGGVMAVELVERNLRYLNDYAPTLPAPERDPSTVSNARPAGTAVIVRGEENGNYVNYSGVFGDLMPDRDSPVYLLTDTGLYEAVPGPEGFSAWLEDGEVRQIIFTAEGELVSLDCVQ